MIKNISDLAKLDIPYSENDNGYLLRVGKDQLDMYKVALYAISVENKCVCCFRGTKQVAINFSDIPDTEDNISVLNSFIKYYKAQ